MATAHLDWILKQIQPKDSDENDDDDKNDYDDDNEKNNKKDDNKGNFLKNGM